MNKFFLAGCAFGVLLSSASAQQKSPEQYREEQSHILGVEGLEAQTYSRFVASGAKQRIDFYTSVNPDCSATGDVTVRVTKQPEHGTVETVTTTHYPRYAKENVRSNCNQHKVKGTLVNYKAAEKYTGSDEFDLLILYPGGFAREHHFNITVR
jgi:RecJ-like exonuclease